MWKNDICGIYKIVNLVNHKIYIGQSKHIKQRWSEHKKELRRNRHKNVYLQRAWNKYGENNFSHEIIELCDESKLDELEQFYIKQFNSSDPSIGYNLTDGGERNINYSKATREKLRFNASGLNNPNHKRVICLETGIVYDTIISAANDYEIFYSMISRCCSHEINEAAGCHWLFYDEYTKLSDAEIDKILSLHAPGRERKVIYLNTLSIFNSIKEAGEKLQINANSISQCCLHNRKTAGKDSNGNPRIFQYYQEFLKEQNAKLESIS